MRGIMPMMAIAFYATDVCVWCLFKPRGVEVNLCLWNLRSVFGVVGFVVVAAICFMLSLASAMRYLASRVAPVRGGTYFSLPPQRKVGKRKRLTPPILDLCPRAPNVPILHTPAPWLVPVANASNKRLTRFNYPYPGQRQRMV
ncbi:hypothetical protein, partial [Paraburkholderia caribensis]|uniref:hypothetical protein n=1 Tax=Paraburkholderia caribensis TaxID=75105 RepID=UPI0034D36292